MVGWSTKGAIHHWHRLCRLFGVLFTAAAFDGTRRSERFAAVHWLNPSPPTLGFGWVCGSLLWAHLSTGGAPVGVALRWSPPGARPISDLLSLRLPVVF